MDINPEYQTFYTTQYKEALRKYVESQSRTKHRSVPVNKLETVASGNLVPSATSSGSSESSFDPYDFPAMMRNTYCLTICLG
jgi:hypothetical protein